MKPFSRATPAFSRPRSAVKGRRPVQTRARSVMMVWPFWRVVFTLPALIFMFSTAVAVWVFTPWAWRVFWMLLETSGSAMGRSRSSISTTVTAVPSSMKMVANSQPMYPPPTMRRDSGCCWRARISSLVMTLVRS